VLTALGVLRRFCSGSAMVTVYRQHSAQRKPAGI